MEEQAPNIESLTEFFEIPPLTDSQIGYLQAVAFAEYKYGEPQPNPAELSAFVAGMKAITEQFIKKRS